MTIVTMSSDVKVLTGECKEIVEDEAITHPYKRDPFQQHAFVQIVKGNNVLITAHTSCGKTTPAIDAIAHLLREAHRKGEEIVIVYTSPIKALSNQKLEEFKLIFAEFTEKTGIPVSCGLITGDNQINPGGNLLLVTTEILLNSLQMDSDQIAKQKLTEDTSQKHLSNEMIDRVRCVIFDEIHFFNDPERGHVWEKCLVLLEKKIQLLMLSATIDQADRFAAWIGRIKGKPTYLIPTEKRVVPLQHFVFAAGKMTMVCAENDNFLLTNYQEAHKEFESWALAKKKKHQRPPYTNLVKQVVHQMERIKLLPAIFFVFSKNNCERYARMITHSLLTPEEKKRSAVIFHNEIKEFKKDFESERQYLEIMEMTQRGVAYHHSGVYKVLRELVEKLFKAKLIKILMATETFAVGVNMPTRSVVFTSLEKHDGKRRRPLRPDEFKQMSGRAGRRGVDSAGTVIILPIYKLPSPPEIRSIFLGKVPSLRSQFSIDYSFILKIANSKRLNFGSFLDLSLYQREKNSLRLTEEKKEPELQALVEKHHQIFTDRIQHLIRLEEIKEEEREKYETTTVTQCQKYYELSQEPKPDDFGGLMVTRTLNKKDKQFMTRFKNDGSMMSCYLKYEKWQKAAEELKKYQEELTSFNNYDADRIRRFAYILYQMGYLEQYEDLERLTPEAVSVKGIMANNCDKVNPILVVEIITRKILHGLTPEQIVALLGVFIQEGSRKDEEVLISQVEAPVQDQLYWIEEIVTEAQAIEAEVIPSGSMDHFWHLDYSFVDAAYLWAKQNPPKACMMISEIKEGNFVKAILRINDLVKDIINLCLIYGDEELVPVLGKIEPLLIRGVVSVASLYFS